MPVRIKICGVTSTADAELAASLGAEWIGLNFYPKSPRCVQEASARAIVAALPSSVTPVALFVNEPLFEAQRRAQAIGVNTVQIYGATRELLPSGTRWICAYSVADATSLQPIVAYLEMQRAVGASPEAILVDAHVPGMHGGTGQTAPWHLLADFQPGVPVILAGGLTPDNVAEAIRIVQPYAVDVASGVESAPGKKDPEKLRRFIDAVRGA